MLNPKAKPFVFNKPKTFAYNKPAKEAAASPTMNMIQSSYYAWHNEAPPPPFPYHNHHHHPSLYPFPNTTPSCTLNNNPVYPHRCPLLLPPHPTFTSSNHPWKKNSNPTSTKRMTIQVKCPKMNKFDNVVHEVKKGPRCALGDETRRKKAAACVFMWRPKGKGSSRFDFVEHEAQLQGKTTVMVKNIPNKLSKKVLLEYLDKHCCEENEKMDSSSTRTSPSEYDFVYLPMDFRSGFNLGYAFVNFTSAEAAVRFYKSYHNHKWEFYCSNKICEIKLARIQGRQELIRHFRTSSFLCHTDDFLPTIFSPPRNGGRAPDDDDDATSPKACVVAKRRWVL